MNKSFLGNLTVILAALMWGCVGIFTKSLYSLGLRAIDITFVRGASTALIMTFIILIFDRKLFKIKLKHIPIFLGSGIASYLFFNFCYMSSIAENSLSIAAILMYTSPLWVTIISAPLFKEKITIKKAAALVLALGGCALVSFQGAVRITPVGLVFGLCSGIGYALYTIFGRIGLRHYSSVTVTFYTFLFATLGGLPFALTGPLPEIITSPPVILWSLGAGVFTTLCPYLLYTFGLSKIPSSIASIISIIEPIAATVVGFILFDEKLTAGSVIGIITVVAALVLLEIPLGKKGITENEAQPCDMGL